MDVTDCRCTRRNRSASKVRRNLQSDEREIRQDESNIAETSDETYALRPPSDWHEFLEHGADPVDLGYYTWQRLTRPDIDFQRLRAAIDTLKFEKLNKAAPLYDPSNLHSLPVKLLVVKKHSRILANLVKDLKLIRTRLTDLPSLIIDDESDQAGLNTVDPRKPSSSGEERSKTNARIVDLLQLFPRGRYVGYTATPYANALVNPDDPEDLFPKDFIVSLDWPRGYMGVLDFFDPLTDYEELRKDDYTQSEIAFIRRVDSSPREDEDDLKKALRSYVLAGSLKLYRQATDSTRCRSSGRCACRAVPIVDPPKLREKTNRELISQTLNPSTRAGQLHPSLAGTARSLPLLGMLWFVEAGYPRRFVTGHRRLALADRIATITESPSRTPSDAEALLQGSRAKRWDLRAQ